LSLYPGTTDYPITGRVLTSVKIFNYKQPERQSFQQITLRYSLKYAPSTGCSKLAYQNNNIAINNVSRFSRL